MTITFYPHPDDTQKGTIDERVEVLMDAAERYRTIVLDAKREQDVTLERKISLPKDQAVAIHWDEVAQVLREIRELPEGNKEERIRKSGLLVKLAEIYEVLRAAKMPKLEAVRLALVSEANALGGGTRIGGGTAPPQVTH